MLQQHLPFVRHDAPTAPFLTLNPSVNFLCASLNSGVEKDRRGSSFFLCCSSCRSFCQLLLRDALNVYSCQQQLTAFKWALISCRRAACCGLFGSARRSKSACTKSTLLELRASFRKADSHHPHHAILVTPLGHNAFGLRIRKSGCMRRRSSSGTQVGLLCFSGVVASRGCKRS